MTDIEQQLRFWGGSGETESQACMLQAADEIERLLELLRGVGANRYWEGRWRDAEAALRQVELNTRTGDPKTLKLNWIAREALTGREPNPT